MVDEAVDRRLWEFPLIPPTPLASPLRTPLVAPLATPLAKNILKGVSEIKMVTYSFALTSELTYQMADDLRK